jgi:hypothetical protein
MKLLLRLRTLLRRQQDHFVLTPFAHQPQSPPQDERER